MHRRHCRVAKFCCHEDGIRETFQIRPLARLVILLAMGTVEGSGQSHGSRPKNTGRQSSGRHKLNSRLEKQEKNMVTMNEVRRKEKHMLGNPQDSIPPDRQGP
ncbi:hypothetical protein H101_01871 [Trichophyton interdigitale H6]|nr:hypothetical protein H101_01871 [Trichophyton interdigitale H6]